MGAELVWGRIDLSPLQYYIHVECASLRQRLHEWQEWVPRTYTEVQILIMKMKLFTTSYVTIR